MIGNFPVVSNFNRFIWNKLPVLPDHKFALKFVQAEINSGMTHVQVFEC
jgi:hypothetical protein